MPVCGTVGPDLAAADLDIASLRRWGDLRARHAPNCRDRIVGAATRTSEIPRRVQSLSNPGLELPLGNFDGLFHVEIVTAGTDSR